MKKASVLLMILILLLSACAVTQQTGDETPTPTTEPTPLPYSDVTPVPVAKFTNDEFALAYYENETLNPVFGESDVNAFAAGFIYDTLVASDNGFIAETALANRFYYDADEDEWVFILREDVKFHSGATLTAQDVKYTINRMYSNSKGVYYENVKNIDSVSAQGNKVRIKLHKKDPLFPMLMNIPIIQDGDTAQTVNGTGAFMLKTDENGKKYLAENASYWKNSKGTADKLEKIKLTAVSSTRELIVALEQYDIDAFMFYDTAVEKPSHTGNLSAYVVNTNRLCYLAFNSERRAFEDSNVRKAVSLALDRKALVDGLWSAKSVSLTNIPLHPNWSLYPMTEAAMYDTVKADEILVNGRYAKNGSGVYRRNLTGELSFTLLVNMENVNRVKLAERIADRLSLFGIKVQTEAVSRSEYLSRIENGEFDIYIAETDMPINMDFTALLDTEKWNYGKIDGDKTLEAMATFRETSPDMAAYTIRELRVAFENEMPFVPLFFSNSTLYVTKNVTGIAGFSQGQPFGDTSGYVLEKRYG